jgi:hypothetical protein
MLSILQDQGLFGADCPESVSHLTVACKFYCGTVKLAKKNSWRVKEFHQQIGMRRKGCGIEYN